MSNSESPYDFGPGESAVSGQSNGGFQVGRIDAMQCLQEGWALIQDKYMLFLGISFVGGLIGGAVPIILLGPMMCGIFLTLFKRMRGEEVSFDDLFKGFDYFKDSLIATLILVGAGMIIAVVWMVLWITVMAVSAAAGETVGPILAIVGFLCFMAVQIVLTFSLQIVFMFVFPLIVDRGLAPMDAIKTSWAAGKANAGGMVVFMLLSAVAAFVGLLMGCVGIYFVVPILQAGQAVVYRRVFPALSGKAAV